MNAEPSTRSNTGTSAIVTGASRGIGAAIARDLAARGFHVVVNYREDRFGAEEVARSIESGGGSASIVCADVGDVREAARLTESATESGRTVAVLVNNAGILRDSTFRKMVEDDWRSVLETNLIGVMNVTHAAVPHMIERKFGRIVNIASFVGQSGNFGQTNYAAAKAGIIGFTKSLALELAQYNVTVNAICPGFIATAMWETIPDSAKEKLVSKIPLRRVGTTADVTHGVAYLIERGDYVTGQTLNINGGIYM
jgi:acetoacetyl-CoA reductase